MDFGRVTEQLLEQNLLKMQQFLMILFLLITQFILLDQMVCGKVMELFGSRLMRAESKLESLIFKDARTRIVEFIKDSVERSGRRIGFEMLLKHSLTHQDIANITCTSRQTVTLVLNELGAPLKILILPPLLRVSFFSLSEALSLKVSPLL